LTKRPPARVAKALIVTKRSCILADPRAERAFTTIGGKTTMRFDTRFFALLSGTALMLGPVAAQTDRAAPARAAAATPAATSFAGSPREKLVVAMPKTYAKSETMLLWGDYFNHLARCGNIDLQNLQGESLEKSTNIDVLGEKELIDSLLSGKAQLAQVNPGLVPQLVGAGQPAPFGVPGNKASGKRNSYTLILISRVDSPFTKPQDLVGKKIAHSTPTSNSGNLAPRALFPAIGLVPDQNYEVVFSNGHERSVTGVMHGFYPPQPWPAICTNAWSSRAM